MCIKQIAVCHWWARGDRVPKRTTMHGWYIIARNKSLCSESIDKGTNGFSDWAKQIFFHYFESQMRDIATVTHLHTPWICSVSVCVAVLGTIKWNKSVLASPTEAKHSIAKMNKSQQRVNDNGKDSSSHSSGTTIQEQISLKHTPEADLLLFNVNSMLCIQL